MDSDFDEPSDSDMEMSTTIIAPECRQLNFHNHSNDINKAWGFFDLVFPPIFILIRNELTGIKASLH